MMTVCADTVDRYAESVSHLLDLGFRYVIASLDYAGAWSDWALAELRRQDERLAGLYEEWMREERKFYFSPFEVKLASHIHGADYARERCELGLRRSRSLPTAGSTPACNSRATGRTRRLQSVTCGPGSTRRTRRVGGNRRQRTRAVPDVRDRAAVQSHVRLPQLAGDGAPRPRVAGPLRTRAHARATRGPPGRAALWPTLGAVDREHYNAVYPLLSLIEDDEEQAG